MATLFFVLYTFNIIVNCCYKNWNQPVLSLIAFPFNWTIGAEGAIWRSVGYSLGLEVTRSISQRLVLAATLFLIFINYLLAHSRIRAFADYYCFSVYRQWKANDFSNSNDIALLGKWCSWNGNGKTDKIQDCKYWLILHGTVNLICRMYTFQNRVTGACPSDEQVDALWS